MLDNIRIVLNQTYHPGNIGAAARAMKTMGLSRLWLVRPRAYPHADAEARAAGAGDILQQARVVPHLDAAIGDCPLVIGTSARSRSLPWPMLNARECGAKVVMEACQAPVALVFGRERMGLHNAELRQCHFHLMIDTAPDYSVLNLAAAVQVVSYEIQMARRQLDAASTATERPGYADTCTHADTRTHADTGAMEAFYRHLQVVLEEIGFLNPRHPGQSLIKLRRLFNRARPEKQELRMLRGILSRVQATRALPKASEQAADEGKTAANKTS